MWSDLQLPLCVSSDLSPPAHLDPGILAGLHSDFETAKPFFCLNWYPLHSLDFSLMCFSTTHHMTSSSCQPALSLNDSKIFSVTSTYFDSLPSTYSSLIFLSVHPSVPPSILSQIKIPEEQGFSRSCSLLYPRYLEGTSPQKACIAFLFQRQREKILRWYGKCHVKGKQRVPWEHKWGAANPAWEKTSWKRCYLRCWWVGVQEISRLVLQVAESHRSDF